MYKEILRSIEGVEMGGVLAFMIFFVFFLVMIIYLVKMKKEYIDEMKHLPLDELEK
ncbi:MAG: cbb3-type cytochrome c oxidase subunit 3 [Bacteroidetes bacterium]|nr:cbb3-type cytochrome c oxidase subunit 3 [Bacteroidota bacterium]